MLDLMAFDWGRWALAASVALCAAWLAALWRHRPDAGAAAVGASFLVTAFLAVAALMRNLLDAGFNGYSFGLLHAAPGWPALITAGGVLLHGAVAAFAILHREHRAAALIAGIAGLYLLICLAPTVLATLFTDPDVFEIRFGDDLTVPGNVAVVSVLALLTGYAAAAIWGAAALFAGRRASI